MAHAATHFLHQRDVYLLFKDSALKLTQKQKRKQRSLFSYNPNTYNEIYSALASIENKILTPIPF